MPDDWKDELKNDVEAARREALRGSRTPAENGHDDKEEDQNCSSMETN